jgi:hypothetical protein
MLSPAEGTGAITFNNTYSCFELRLTVLDLFYLQNQPEFTMRKGEHTLGCAPE